MKGTLLPVRVQECDLKGLFGQIINIDLVEKDEAQAKNELVSGVHRERAKPLTKPEFPAKIHRSISKPPLFPGARTRKIPIALWGALAVLLVTAVIYASRSRPLVTWLEPPRPCSKLPAGKYYEAEAAELSGDASRDSEHLGYSGDGYVSGYGHGSAGTATTFRVDVSTDALYPLDLCYGNATGSSKTLTIYINDEPLKQIRLPNASRWSVWTSQTESVPLTAGHNTISYRKNLGDTGQVNLDFIRIAEGSFFRH